MRKILRNRTIVLVLLLALLVTAASGWKVWRVQNAVSDRQNALDGYDWLVPLGQYEWIYGAELDSGSYFLLQDKLTNVSMDGTRQPVYADTVVDSQGRDVPEELSGFGNMEKSGLLLDISVHPAGYGIMEFESTNGPSSYSVRTLSGEALYSDGGRLELSQVPGYVISFEKNAVIDLKTGETVYEPPEGERVIRQEGNFWRMELDLPWYENGDTLTVEYLRDMDFQVALGGRLSSGASQVVKDGLIIGDLVVNGDYYNWPSEYIEVEWLVLDAATGLPAEGFAEYNIYRFSGDGDGWLCTRNDDGSLRMHVTEPGADETAVWFDLPEDVKPVGPMREGLAAVRDGYGRFGFLDRTGQMVTDFVFDRVSSVHDGCAAVKFEDSAGIIRLKGGADES